ncbi:MAG: SDR family NAD(P)-dependent oxidoreductase [Acetobacteraceae bacterium]|nr:SDR family NAD(P)-dependent oxidoreductase [Acetobacteraceae bacterium]
MMGRVYLITGASSGFGRALAEAVLQRGDRAVIGARRTGALEELAKRYPAGALAVGLDVTDGATRERAVQAALDRFGRIDVLANIAGRGSLGAAEEFSPAQLREQMEVNFFAAAEMTRAVLPAMRAQGSGHILQLTSIGGLAAFGGFGPYCASKFALEGWSEALRDEVGPLGIRVTIVEPGAFRTEFAGSSNMRPERRLDAYRPVIEPVEAYLYGSDGKQPGDPRRAAEAMIAAVESDNPPLRLLLGTDAIGLWEKKQAALAADLAHWRAIGEATAFEGATVAPVGG